MNRSIWQLALLLALVMAVPGCGAKRPHPIEGKIVFDDSAPATELSGFIVGLSSSDHSEGANGVVQADGTFRVGTYKNADGALPGKYRVSLTPPDPPLDQPAPKPIIDSKYGDADTSGLEIEVKPDTSQVTLTVERARR